MTRATRATIQAIRPDSLNRPPVGAPGVVLGGKYRLEEAIARGGMARVWRATHVTLNRPVAVKFVDAWGVTPEERSERFLREAKVAAAVRHRHVVDILDFGTTQAGEPYMVMELLEGETLDQRLSHGPMPDDEIVEIAAQLLSGLDAVHRAGIVHRDLKPGNVFITDDEVDGVFARLLDFGISQGADDVETEERVVVGTPEYMSPEQAFGEPLDARSDLYSVGVVLYEMLSGLLPFEDADPQKVVDMVANEVPAPLHSFRPDIPDLCAVVERAMSPLVGARYASAREMRRALLAAVGRGPDVTGRNSIVPRDSRVSGLQAKAVAATVTAGGADRSDATEAALPLRSSAPPEEGPPQPSGRGWALGAGVVLVLVALGAAVAWVSSSGGPPSEATASGATPAAAAPSSIPEAAPAPAEVEAEPAPAPPEADPVDSEDAEGEAEAAGAPTPARAGRPRRTQRSSEAAAPEPTIRRELDF